jgi:hypothetical protein
MRKRKLYALFILNNMKRMYKIFQRNIQIELSQIIFDLENQNRSYHNLFIKDPGEKPKLLLIRKLSYYRLIKLIFYNILNNVTIM